jgi:hypothetical protein
MIRSTLLGLLHAEHVAERQRVVGAGTCKARGRAVLALGFQFDPLVDDFKYPVGRAEEHLLLVA